MIGEIVSIAYLIFMKKCFNGFYRSDGSICYTSPTKGPWAWVYVNLFFYSLYNYIRCTYPSLFLFIRGLYCPSCIQASLSLNCLKLTIPHNCHPVSCGDIGFKKILDLVLAWKSLRLQRAFLPLGRSCPLQTIPTLSDLVGCDSPLQMVMAGWRTIIVSRELSHPVQKVWIQTKKMPNCHYYLQRAVTPDWMGGIALW